MSERKVLNKYYPPDFDPTKIPKGKRRERNGVFNIRVMAPCNMRCNTCKQYIYKGKKFNSRKENVDDEFYLGLRIFRFYIKCPTCVSEIAFKTDLKNTDYTLEAGATRLFEAEKIAQQMAEQERKEKEEEELNPMKVLENRTKASRLEMDQIDSLEELREMNKKKKAAQDSDEALLMHEKYTEMLQKLQDEEEENEIKAIFGGGGEVVKRLKDDSDDEVDEPAHKKLAVEASKPTDILAQETKPVAIKKPQSWEKSVGSLSSKQSLSKMIVKKKSTPVVVKKTDSSETGSLMNGGTSDCTTTESNGLPQTDKVQSEETVTHSTGTTGLVLATTGSETKVSASQKPAVTQGPSGVSSSSIPAGLGLLGAYSDTDSDDSVD